MMAAIRRILRTPGLLVGLAMTLPQSAMAQVYNGPPIPPGQVLRQQAAPLPGSPPPIAVTPSPPPVNTGALPGPAVVNPDALPSPAVVNVDAWPATRGGATGSGSARYRDRVAWCRHQAAVERVPRRQRGAYVHHCMN
jgi:hypothetical protein